MNVFFSTRTVISKKCVIFHWLLFFMVLGIFLTVPMMDFLSVRHNAKTIQTELAQSGVEIQKEYAFKAAVKIGRGIKKIGFG